MIEKRASTLLGFNYQERFVKHLDIRLFADYLLTYGAATIILTIFKVQKMVDNQVHQQNEVHTPTAEFKQQFFQQLLEKYASADKIPESDWKKILVVFGI